MPDADDSRPAPTMTLDEVAALTGVPPRTVRRAARVGHLRSVRAGRRRPTRRDWVTRWLEIHEPCAARPRRP